MNQGRIWCVVNPTVGLPLFIGSVAVTSLLVHYCVLSNTTWFSQYWNGGAKAKATASAPEDTTRTVSTQAASGGASFVITVSPAVAGGPQADSSFVISVAPDPSARPADQVALAAASPN